MNILVNDVNISYIILAACMMNETGIYAAILHLLFHSFAKISIFFTAGVLMHQADITYIDQIDGLGKKMPITFTLYTLSSLSLTGIPLFSGFISKLEIANATISVGTWYSLVGLIAIFISAMFTAVYTIDLVIRAFFKKPNDYNMENYEMAKEGSYKFLIPISTFAIISVFLGTFAAPFLELIKSLLQGGGL
jgi:multicomponent Na+:H+ antiporter subunit D